MTSTYVPWLYDVVHHGAVGGDTDFYLRLARECGGPVLELGAGTGRTLLPIVRAGIDCVGLELDDGMRERLERHVERLPAEVRDRAQIVAGDMRDLDLGEARFALVQIPFRAFLHNLERADQLACLAGCLRHLVPGGTLALNCFHPSLEHMSAKQGQRWAWSGDVTLADGRDVVMSEATTYDTGTQQLTSRLRYELLAADGRVEDTWIQRLELAYLYPGDLRDLLHTSGFVDIEIFGGPDGRPFTRDGEELYVVARRPGESND